MLLSNRQRKFMSLLLCLLMIFTIFSWNVQQVHANPIVAVGAKYVVGGILAGMGYVATTTEGQEALGQFVYDHVNDTTKQRLQTFAAMVGLASNQAVRLSSSLWGELNEFMSSRASNSLFQDTVTSGIVLGTFQVGQRTGLYQSNYPQGTKFYVYSQGALMRSASSTSNTVGYYSHPPGLISKDGSIGYCYIGDTYIEFGVMYPMQSNNYLVATAPASVTSIPLDSTFEPKNSVPPPFWLPINDMGTITLPTSQDALYDGVPIAPDIDVPYTPGETTGTVEGDVGIVAGLVGTIGQLLSNIWAKILEMLSSMVEFFQAIMAWVNAFFSELALTIEAVLTEFFTVPTPFVLPTDMFDGMLDDLLDKTGLSAFDQTFSRLKNLQTGYGSPPEITINLHQLMAATTNIGSGFSVPLANKESLVIDFAKLQEVEFWNMSLIDLIRALLSLSMVGMTFNYIYRKIIPDKVIE